MHISIADCRASSDIATVCHVHVDVDVVFVSIVGDNEDCVTEWFHLSCVGLETKPRGKWMCADCRKKKKKSAAADETDKSHSSSAATSANTAAMTTGKESKSKKQK